MDKVREFLTELVRLGSCLTTRYVLLDVPEEIEHKFKNYNTLKVRTLDEAQQIRQLNGYHVVLVAPSNYNTGEFTFLDINDIKNVNADDIPYYTYKQKGGCELWQDRGRDGQKFM